MPGPSFCPVCRSQGLSETDMRAHVRRHGERRFEAAKARAAGKALAGLPRHAPGFPLLRLFSQPRGGLPEEERRRQNLAAVEQVLRQPGGAMLLRRVARQCPEEFQNMLRLAERERPEVAGRLRALRGGPDA